MLLAGVRNIQPRPVGFKFHAVLVVNSAHLASLASPDSDRWLPILWAVDQFKSSQAADVRAGDWTLGPVDEAAVPAADKARAAFVAAMDRWDEAAADAAIAGLARTARPGDIFEVLARYGARDFREIGHKAIYVANSFRTLDVIGWQHAEPVLRSLAYALLDKDGDSGNPSTSDLPADRPYRHNQPSAARLRAGWTDGRASADGAREMLHALRQATPEAASALAIDLVNRGVAPQSIFEACFESSAELMMRSPGILALHATTFTNAVGYAFQRCRDDGTRRLLLLQNASFLPLFRGAPVRGVAIDTLEPLPPRSTGPAAIEEIFAEVSRERPVAARKVLGFLDGGGDVRPLADAIRRLISSRAPTRTTTSTAPRCSTTRRRSRRRVARACSRPGPSISRAARRPTRRWRNRPAAPWPGDGPRARPGSQASAAVFPLGNVHRRSNRILREYSRSVNFSRYWPFLVLKFPIGNFHDRSGTRRHRPEGQARARPSASPAGRSRRSGPAISGRAGTRQTDRATGEGPGRH